MSATFRLDNLGNPTITVTGLVTVNLVGVLAKPLPGTRDKPQITVDISSATDSSDVSLIEIFGSSGATTTVGAVVPAGQWYVIPFVQDCSWFFKPDTVTPSTVGSELRLTCSFHTQDKQNYLPLFIISIQDVASAAVIDPLAGAFVPAVGISGAGSSNTVRFSQ